MHNFFKKVPKMTARLRVESGSQAPRKNSQIKHVALGKYRVQVHENENW